MANTGPRTGYRGTPRERLERRLERRPSGCLEWTGGRARGGYGSIYVNGVMVPAHRLAWELAYGPIPDGEVIRHFVCDNPPCCDVTHLRPGTHADNSADMVAHNRQGRNGNEKKTHCPQRHAYDDANTLIRPNGKRKCRACGRAEWSIWYRRKKAELAGQGPPWTVVTEGDGVLFAEPARQWQVVGGLEPAHGSLYDRVEPVTVR